MSHESENSGWPAEAGDRRALATEMEPPADLENRVVETLRNRGLIGANLSPVSRHVGWRAMRASLAAAACVALVAIGIFIGRNLQDRELPLAAALTGGETDLYALLLYETDGLRQSYGC